MSRNHRVLFQSIEGNRHQSPRELVEKFSCNQSIIVRHLHEFGKVSKKGSWSPHETSADNKMHHLTNCLSFLTHSKNSTFFRWIVIGDEKWVYYVNFRLKHQWLNPGQVGLPPTDSKIWFSLTKSYVACLAEYGWFSVFQSSGTWHCHHCHESITAWGVFRTTQPWSASFGSSGRQYE